MIANRLVLLTALTATIVVGGTRAAQAENTAPQSQRGLSDQDVQSAADQLLVLVNPSRRENSYFPPFARQEIEWMNAQAKANVLSIILLKDLANTNLSVRDLMGRVSSVESVRSSLRNRDSHVC